MSGLSLDPVGPIAHTVALLVTTKSISSLGSGPFVAIMKKGELLLHLAGRFCGPSVLLLPQLLVWLGCKEAISP